jgi:hypothetical protein
VLEDAIEAAARAMGEGDLGVGHPRVSASGVLVALSDRVVFKTAMGPGREDIDRHRAGIELVASALPGAVVRERLPRLYGCGVAGLAYWSLEGRLAGDKPSALTDSVLSDCLEFLVELHSCRTRAALDRSLEANAKLVGAVLDRERSAALERLCSNLATELAALPRGIGHGDFARTNILADRGGLCGVVDWAGATRAQLPLLDLMNLLVSEREPRHFGRALMTYLMPYAAAGGDDLTRAYCERLGLELTTFQFEALAIAWWLDRVARELQNYGDRMRRPVWVDENVRSVLTALLARHRR